MIFYKIQHKITKQYSKGGSYVGPEGVGYHWSPNAGKIWDTLGKLRAHITSHLPDDYSKGTDMSNWEVVELEMTVKARKDIHEVIDPKKLVQLLKQ